MDCVNVTSSEQDSSDFVEVDPTGRYGRYNEILGKGASKTVYRAFDEYEGIEVAWNQVKLYDFLQSPEELERLYCEIHLLKTLKHKNIMKFYTSWVDTANRNINFVTEMFTSGTLRQYRLKHRKVNIRAVKNWCRQILSGLLYLHSRNPPVIHRDLKCDNIFINGNQGEVKIGDLGLAAILRKSHAAHCVGTPEFMAPEVYEEEYNELVDIYSFGMCILEMVTFEYPYSECTHPAQIYKKVISGKKPEALTKVEDPDVREFIEKCLATASSRLPARELLMDPFLQIDDYDSDMRSLQYLTDYDELDLPLLKQPWYGHSTSSLSNGYANYIDYDPESNLDYYPLEYHSREMDCFSCQGHDHSEDFDISIKGKRREDDGIFLRLRIADKEGRIRNIYFPFDITNDTALSVATEMVSELDITDQDVTKIADIIDGEIATLVPGWKKGPSFEETTHPSSCLNCSLSHSCLPDYVTSESYGAKNLQVLPGSNQGCAAVHGRFEEITYQVDGTEQCSPEGEVTETRQSESNHYTDIWAQQEGQESSSQETRDIHCDERHETLEQTNPEKEEKVINVDTQSESDAGNSFDMKSLLDCGLSEEYENEIRQELRWLKAKYQMQLRELRDHQLGIKSKSSSLSLIPDDREHAKDDKLPLSSKLPRFNRNEKHLTSDSPTDIEKIYGNLSNQWVQNHELMNRCCPPRPEMMVTAKNYYAGALLPHSLHRASSLPVDAVDV